ncbi:carbohydrate ABC transporter permease [Paenibacillus sp. FSL H7-0331]
MYSNTAIDLQARKSKASNNRLRRIETMTGYVFVGPMLLGVLVLVMVPVIASLLLSFADWNFVAGIDQMKFVGLGNFKRLEADPIFWKSIMNNMLFILIVPLTMILALLLAVVINKSVYGKDLFKIIYFMPYISSIVAIGIVWQVLFHPSHGPVNQMLIAMGVSNPPKWLADVNYALPSLMGIMTWAGIGFNLIIYMAGLQSIPKDLYEAAEMDGASPWVQLTRITIPMLSPTSFFLLVTGIIGSFKVFNIISVLTQGGPARSTSVLVYYLYETAFINLNIGYASAMALVLFVFVLLITLIQWYGQKKWVNY